MQNSIFDYLEIKPSINKKIDSRKVKIVEIIKNNYYQLSKNNNYYQLQNRRYIGSKQKLINWIFTILKQECEGESFLDIFAGTGIVGLSATTKFKKVIFNDFLFSNNIIYEGFFSDEEYNQEYIIDKIKNYNQLNSHFLEENYFSKNFGGKYFSKNSAKIIGFIREDIEKNKNNLSKKEYSILISSLLYSIDSIANTVGHYDAYFKKNNIEDEFIMKPIKTLQLKNIKIFREDANDLAKKIQSDIVYIDPPYNSRQYSRFYHILENLTQWKKPKLHGVALKPEAENMSDYCRVNAKVKLSNLINDLTVKYLVVSYNNTYQSKSNSSKNKITLQEINEILIRRGETKIFEKNYRHFNAGNTNFNDHKEYLFVTKVEAKKN